VSGPQSLKVRFQVSRAPMVWRDPGNALWASRLDVLVRSLDGRQPWELYSAVVTGTWATSQTMTPPVIAYPAAELHRAPGWVSVLTADALELAQEVRVLPILPPRPRRVGETPGVLIGGVVSISSGWDDPGVPLIA
jgi:hypothetical protein